MADDESKAKHAAYMRAYRQANLEQMREQERNRYASGPKQAYMKVRYEASKLTATDEDKAQKKAQKKAYLKAWYEANKERVSVERKAYHAAYRAANKEKAKAWREANKDKVKADDAARYAADREQRQAAMRENYRQNPDAYKARAVQWKAENPERFKAMRKAAYVENIEKNREVGRLDWLKHGDKRRAAKNMYRKAHPGIGAHHVRLRQTRKQMATPQWANLDAIKAIYRQAACLKHQTGLEWHVDHEIPLKHPLVCGLHVEFNLRVILGALNQSKHNKFEVL